MFSRIAAGHTDLVFDWVRAGHPVASRDSGGVSVLEWCAYHGDVSAIRLLLANGESLETLGANFDLNGASFHGHWRLCRFLLEHGADANAALTDTGETPLHSALCKLARPGDEQVVEVLLEHGADPNRATNPAIPTGSFMRDCRTRAETPLHRAAAFGSEATLKRLLAAGANRDAKDMNGDSPLTWASWHLRPAPILRLLCFGEFTIHPDHA
ncbi:MAG: ankyrin repeat domain-containing protein [Candidatus Eisenbacteria bacterium]|uniref:Ankyrin repeat domain-containing protein n=1 Tax=Eiseniibacteriota bacterium TaxID=2212470 RepID=A0A849SJX8_UNCEI|nr:ankyrin repeat domain-containing protein [Candidatus Eisenbacteria bacterium]